MGANDLCFLSITQLAEQIQNKSVSPVEVTQAYLDRIAAIESKLNSYLTITAERALQEARTAEAEIRANAYRGPLHGIPLAHKDIVATRGIKTTCASKVLKDNIPDYDATVIERLQAAGSVLLGKLNMNEFATMLPSQHFGRVNNPRFCKDWARTLKKSNCPRSTIFGPQSRKSFSMEKPMPGMSPISKRRLKIMVPV